MARRNEMEQESHTSLIGKDDDYTPSILIENLSEAINDSEEIVQLFLRK